MKRRLPKDIPQVTDQRVRTLVEHLDQNDLDLVVDELRQLGYTVEPPERPWIEGTNAVE